MVRNVADRAFLPAKSLLQEVGDMMVVSMRVAGRSGVGPAKVLNTVLVHRIGMLARSCSGARVRARRSENERVRRTCAGGNGEVGDKFPTRGPKRRPQRGREKT